MSVDRIKTTDMAHGRWTEILLALGIPGNALSGRNGPCLFCGGKDRARFTNYKDGGWYFCNQCGKYSGIQFVMKFLGVPFKEAANRVDAILGGNSFIAMNPAQRPSTYDTRIPRATRDCALWIKKRHPEQLESWLAQHTIEVRWWLETQSS